MVKATFDTTTIQGQQKIFNAKNGAGQSLKTLENGHVIEVSDILIYEQKINSYGNGETESKITVLFTPDGESYAGISETVSKAGENLIEFFEQTGVESVKVKLVKQKSSKNQEFLNLQMVFS